MKNIYILFLFSIILCSCRSTNFSSCKGSDPLLEDFGRKVVDTVHVTRELHDSVYVFESEKTLSGSPTEGREGCIVDTLVKNHVEFRWRISHDSVLCHKVDTVPVVKIVERVKNVEKVQKVPRERKWYDWMSYTITFLVFALSILYIIGKLKS